MSVVLNFDSLSSLNDYWINSFSRIEEQVILQPTELKPLIENNAHTAIYSQVVFTEKLLHSLQDKECNHHYVLLSKTNYRKLIHPDLPDSLYKKFFSVLKDNGYIVDFSTSFVILLNTPITEEIFNLLSVKHSNDIKTFLDDLLDRLDASDKDTQYYLKYISNLEEKCMRLQDDVDQARQDLMNKSITTWY